MFLCYIFYICMASCSKDTLIYVNFMFMFSPFRKLIGNPWPIVQWGSNICINIEFQQYFNPTMSTFQLWNIIHHEVVIMLADTGSHLVQFLLSNSDVRIVRIVGVVCFRRCRRCYGSWRSAWIRLKGSVCQPNVAALWEMFLI